MVLRIVIVGKQVVPDEIIVGIVLLTRVDEQEGIRVAEAENLAAQAGVD